MGKIRVKTIGDESLEKEQKNEAKKRKEAKKVVKAPGMKGGERVVAVGPTEEELGALEKKEEVEKEALKNTAKAKKQTKNQRKAFHSQKYITIAQSFDKTQNYALSEALELLEKLQRKSFDETVELHINTLST